MHSTTPRPRPGFTLTELLVVIALIVLLVGLLLAALGQVQQKAKQTTTTATMQAFANACETFSQEHGFYPGFVPEDLLIAQPTITGTENALLHMMGGYRRYADFPGPENDYYAKYPIDEWLPFNFDQGDYKTSVNLANIGEGPIINDKPYAPYFAPSGKDFGAVEGQVGDPPPDSTLIRLPDLLDAWGQPIVFLRAQRSIGPLTSTNVSARPQFSPAGFLEYCSSTELGRAGKDQVYDAGQGNNPGGSILSGDDDEIISANLRRILEHPALPGQARGTFMLLSAGKDGVYFSAQDGPGSSENNMEVYNVDQWIIDEGASGNIFSEYDDVLIFGGSS